MSKLTRYKKTATVKLPLPKKHKSTCDDDDDDFIEVPKLSYELLLKPSQELKSAKNNPSSASALKKSKPRKNYNNDDSQPSSTNSSHSEYFDQGKTKIEEVKVKVINNNSDSYNDDDKVEIMLPNKSNNNKIKPPSKTRSCKIKLPLPKKASKVIKDEDPNTNIMKNVNIETVDKPVDDVDPLLVEKEVTEEEMEKSKTVCPFCWKHLKDKLTGTVHIKSCAKNLPTNQIFEALQLQEKQIQEWEKLGIAYPGLRGGVATGVTTNNKGRRGATTSRKQKKKHDPELELAIALSESLHEEVERRKRNENEFIITSDLQNEIELLPISDKPVIDAVTKVVPPSKPPNKRGKKCNISELPLFKASEKDQKSDVGKRLNIILDEQESVRSTEFCIRNVPSIKTLLGSSSRLKDLTKPDALLWNLSMQENTASLRKETFVNQAISDCKNSVPSTVPKHRETRRSGFEESKKLPLPDVSASSSSTCDLQTRFVTDILRMFADKIDTDLTVYGKEEKPIKCHKFIVKARCPKLYCDIVKETTHKGVNCDIIPLTYFSHAAVKAFVKFLYCGKLKTSISSQDVNQVEILAEKYDVQLEQKISSTSNTNIEVKNEVNLIEEEFVLSELERSNLAVYDVENEIRREVPNIATDEMDRVDSPCLFEDSEEEENVICGNKDSNSQTPLFENWKGDGSRDMFEDSEEDDDDVTKIKEEKKNVNNNYEDDFRCFEDELLTQAAAVIVSPRPFSGKRTRSLSPFSDTKSYTASQMAMYIDKIENSPNKQQANKKHKLDTLSDLSDDDYIELGTKKCEVVLDKSTEIDNVVNNSRTRAIRSKNRKTLNISFSQPSPKSQFLVSSFQDNTIQDNFSEDPFANGSDSCFLNLPSVLLQSTPQQNKTSTSSPIIRPCILSPLLEQHASLADKLDENKKKSKGRKKPQLPRARSQEITPSEKPKPVARPNIPNALDYSTIDTPILKRELKRFGLKPLPRSKAKVILRHIIQETNKDQI